MSRFESVLFDLDGTLVDSKRGVIDCLRHAVAAAGIEPPSPAEMNWCVGPPLRSVFERLLSSNEPGLIEKTHATYINHYEKDGIFKARVFDGVIEMLDRLYQRDLRLFVVTSKLALTAQRMVRTLDLNSFFDSVIGAEVDGRLAEKTKSVAFALRRENLSLASTAMVGDREQDMAGARHNRVFGIGVEYGYGSRAELSTAGANAICASPAAVADLLLNSA